MFGIPVGELAILAAAVAGGGIVTGIMAGLFGIGGGAVIVPVLYEVFGALGVAEDIRMQLCLGTSLAIIVPTTFRSYFTHRSKNLGLDDVVRKWTLPAIAGVATGAAVAAVAPAVVFKVAFAVIAGVIAMKLLFGRKSWRIADDLPRGPTLRLFGYLIGFASSLMGVSGGSLANMIMMLYGKTIHTAVATSAGLGVPIALAGTIGFMLAGLPHQSQMPPLSLGYVSLVGFVVMAPVSSYVAGFGAKLAHKTPQRRLEIVFGLFLAVMSVRFIVASFQ
ncbi:MAG TPA: sulfite exporter TauE/SafE family protein [Xanthobacteraceae bacterium]|nr:sulfite exporter TauE/SafE family protein [Xanthobacteraceae bacterium]